MAARRERAALLVRRAKARAKKRCFWERVGFLEVGVLVMGGKVSDLRAVLMAWSFCGRVSLSVLLRARR